MKRILIIRMSSLGDVLLTSPLIRLLRKKFPKARIDFLVRTEYADLIRYNPHLSNIIEFDVDEGFKGLRRLKKSVKTNNYDIILDIHLNLRSIYLTGLSLLGPKTLRIRKDQIKRFLLVQRGINLYQKFNKPIVPVWKKYIRSAKSLDITPDDQGLELYLSDDARKSAEDFYRDLPPGNWKVVIAPGAKHFTKRWPSEYYAALIQAIHQKMNLNSILVGGAEDIPVIGNILKRLPHGIAFSAAGKFSILETSAIIERSQLVISNDSGLMHVAAALNRPLIAIFGSTVEELGFFPYSDNATVLENKGLYCRPCSHIGRESCPEGHFRCMLEIKPDQVLKLVNQKMGTV